MNRKNRRICLYCDKSFEPKGRNWKRQKYCNKSCRGSAWRRAHKEEWRKYHRERAARIQQAYQAYKEKIGCQLCGYNKYGGSLDFHHTEGKDFLINGYRWYANSEATKEQLVKCILVCKNCHYELHHRKHQNEKEN